MEPPSVATPPVVVEPPTDVGGEAQEIDDDIIMVGEDIPELDPQDILDHKLFLQLLDFTNAKIS